MIECYRRKLIKYALSVRFEDDLVRHKRIENNQFGLQRAAVNKELLGLSPNMEFETFNLIIGVLLLVDCFNYGYIHVHVMKSCFYHYQKYHGRTKIWLHLKILPNTSQGLVVSRIQHSRSW